MGVETDKTCSVEKPRFSWLRGACRPSTTAQDLPRAKSRGRCATPARLASPNEAAGGPVPRHPLSALRRSKNAQFARGGLGRFRRDLCILFLLVMGTMVASFQQAQRVPSALARPTGTDVWFEGNPWRTVGIMSNRLHSETFVTDRHPLFPLLTFPEVRTQQAVLHIKPLASAHLLMAIIAGLWVGTLFVLLRLVGCHRLDAALVSVVGALSASAVFWLSMPETYTLGSWTILLALLLVALARHRRVSDWGYFAVNVLTLSVTVTNWMAAILATFAQRPWRRALGITVSAFLMVALLWGVEKAGFPHARFFLNQRRATHYLFQRESGGPSRIIESFVFHSMVMPRIEREPMNPDDRQWSKMSVQHSPPGSGSVLGAIATGLWAGLLSLGVWGAARDKQNRPFVHVLGLTLLGQLALHLVYGGEETFLYSLHWLPLLVILAAFATRTRARNLSVGLAGALLVCAGINNQRQFNRAVSFVERHSAQGTSL